MPPTYSLWSSTTIIFVGNLNMVRGTTITNADSFNVLESTVTEQLLSHTVPTLGKIIIGLKTLVLIYDQHQLSQYLLIPL